MRRKLKKTFKFYDYGYYAIILFILIIITCITLVFVSCDKDIVYIILKERYTQSKYNIIIDTIINPITQYNNIINRYKVLERHKCFNNFKYIIGSIDMYRITTKTDINLVDEIKNKNIKLTFNHCTRGGQYFIKIIKNDNNPDYDFFCMSGDSIN